MITYIYEILVRQENELFFVLKEKINKIPCDKASSSHYRCISGLKEPSIPYTKAVKTTIDNRPGIIAMAESGEIVHLRVEKSS
ncbi:MAG: hypothetical protein ACI8RD_007759 [Bacillariaceae sp.]|jgi:hypothetical protein